MNIKLFFKRFFNLIKNSNNLCDKAIEEKRYNDLARSNVNNKVSGFSQIKFGPETVSYELREPYFFYESVIEKYIRKDMRVLEIGSGFGQFSLQLLKFGARVTTTDISEDSLLIQRQNFSSYKNLQTIKCDMESLPFEDGYFDLVTSAGALSYGDNCKVMKEIHRVLRKEGKFICVDSLNHNLIYILNRIIHYFFGRRSLSTLKRMPTLRLIKSYENYFGKLESFFFGSFSWLTPLLTILTNKYFSYKFSSKMDNIIKFNKLSFKFVFIASKIKMQSKSQ